MKKRRNFSSKNGFQNILINKLIKKVMFLQKIKNMSNFNQNIKTYEKSSSQNVLKQPQPKKTRNLTKDLLIP